MFLDRIFFLKDMRNTGLPVESYRMKFKSELTLCLNIFFSFSSAMLQYQVELSHSCIYS